MKIKEAELEDISGIIEVEKTSGYLTDKKFDPTEMIESLFANKKSVTFVAYVNNKIVGYRAFVKKGKTADIGFLAVTRKFQGKGIGQKLLEKSIKEAKKLGCNKMLLEVRKNNFKAINLYNKLRFYVKGLVKNKENKILMERKLK